MNGTVRQSGDLGQMIWSVPEALAYLSRFVALAPGDHRKTDTPAGVDRVEPGARLAVRREGGGDLVVSYARP